MHSHHNIVITWRPQVMFAIVIFAIIGLEFYAGALNKTCYSLDNLGEPVNNIKYVKNGISISHYFNYFMYWLDL